MSEFPNPCPGGGCFPDDVIDGRPLDTADGARCGCSRLVALDGAGRIVDHSRPPS